MSDLKLDVDQAGELKAAFRREGPWTNEEIKMLCEQKGFLSQVRQTLHGLAEIKPVEHVINCDADPFVPSDWSIAPESEQLPNRARGSFKWDPAQVKLYLSKPQRQNKVIQGYKLKKKLLDKPVLSANALDYLLTNPHLIPEEWKSKAVFFWGTVYRGEDGLLYVRCLYWCGGGWRWFCYWLDDGWGSNDPAALRAS